MRTNKTKIIILHRNKWTWPSATHAGNCFPPPNQSAVSHSCSSPCPSLSICARHVWTSSLSPGSVPKNCPSSSPTHQPFARIHMLRISSMWMDSIVPLWYYPSNRLQLGFGLLTKIWLSFAYPTLRLFHLLIRSTVKISWMERNRESRFHLCEQQSQTMASFLLFDRLTCLSDPKSSRACHLNNWQRYFDGIDAKRRLQQEHCGK